MTLSDRCEGLRSRLTQPSGRDPLQAAALCELVEQLGGQVVGCGFLIELTFLSGRERLAPHQTHALISYES